MKVIRILPRFEIAVNPPGEINVCPGAMAEEKSQNFPNLKVTV
jgi:hypothetical protein